MDVQHWIDIAIGVIVTMVAAFAKFVHAKTEKTADDLAALHLHVAQSYVPKTDLERILDKIDRLSDKIDGMNNRH